MIKRLLRKFGPNPLDRKLKRLAKVSGKKVLLTWNRGLGDIPLGLYALTERIRHFVPDAEITFLTRSDLKDGFSLLKNIEVIVDKDWKRGVPINVAETLKSNFDLILENPDPTNWVKWQLGSVTPKLNLSPEWDALCERFPLSKGCVGVHVQTETVYGYEKNWPVEKWQELFRKLTQEHQLEIVLFGFKKDEHFKMDKVLDLRGETSLFEMLSIIKNKCAYLVVPDSGVLSITYYIDADFPIQIASLWADPRQGVLKQNVASPNKYLKHIPLLGKDENVANITVDAVINSLLC